MKHSFTKISLVFYFSYNGGKAVYIEEVLQWYINEKPGFYTGSLLMRVILALIYTSPFFQALPFSLTMPVRCGYAFTFSKVMLCSVSMSLPFLSLPGIPIVIVTLQILLPFVISLRNASKPCSVRFVPAVAELAFTFVDFAIYSGLKF